MIKIHDIRSRDTIPPPLKGEGLRAAAARCPTNERTDESYLLAIGPDAQVNVTEGSASHPLGDAVFLQIQQSNKDKREEGITRETHGQGRGQQGSPVIGSP
jgi:hypothetical protein